MIMESRGLACLSRSACSGRSRGDCSYSPFNPTRMCSPSQALLRAVVLARLCQAILSTTHSASPSITPLTHRLGDWTLIFLVVRHLRQLRPTQLFLSDRSPRAPTSQLTIRPHLSNIDSLTISDTRSGKSRHVWARSSTPDLFPVWVSTCLSELHPLPRNRCHTLARLDPNLWSTPTCPK